MTAPRTNRVFLILLNCFWFGGLPGFWNYLFYTQHRGDYPANADSIGIPLFGSAILAVVFAPIVNLIVWQILCRAKLPASLLIWNNERQLLSVITTIICALICAAAVFVLADIARDAPSSGLMEVPSTLIAIYLALSLRAGLLNLQAKTDQPWD
jgi:hypothetical protein